MENILTVFILALCLVTIVNSFEGCKESEFQCLNGHCINREYLCNQKEDCLDGSDETADACVELVCNQDGYFKCDDICVPDRWFCDGEDDCNDGKDEPEGCERK